MVFIGPHFPVFFIVKEQGDVDLVEVDRDDDKLGDIRHVAVFTVVGCCGAYGVWLDGYCETNFVCWL